MKRNLVEFGFLAVTCLAIAAVIGCSSGNNSSGAAVPVTTSSTLAISPSTVTLGFGAQQTFAGTGGTPPYTYYWVQGNGRIGYTGIFVAPSSNETDIVGVEDSLGATATATITVSSTASSNPDGLSISPTTWSLNQGGSVTLAAISGVANYTFSLISGSGTLVQTAGQSTATFTAPYINETDIVQVTDSNGYTAQATITVSNSISPSGTLKPVYRFYNSSNGDHLYSLNPSEVSPPTWSSDGQVFRVYQSLQSGTEPLYRCRTKNQSNQFHFLSTYANCENQLLDSNNQNVPNILGYVYASSSTGLLPLYRFIIPNGDYFETTDFNEGLKNNWQNYTVIAYVFSN